MNKLPDHDRISVAEKGNLIRDVRASIGDQRGSLAATAGASRGGDGKAFKTPPHRPRRHGNTASRRQPRSGQNAVDGQRQPGRANLYRFDTSRQVTGLGSHLSRFGDARFNMHGLE